MLGFRCCSSVCEVKERDEGMNSVREVRENSNGRKHIQFGGYKATVAPRRSSFRSEIQITQRNQEHHCPLSPRTSVCSTCAELNTP